MCKCTQTKQEKITTTHENILFKHYGELKYTKMPKKKKKKYLLHFCLLLFSKVMVRTFMDLATQTRKKKNMRVHKKHSQKLKAPQKYTYDYYILKS